MKEKFKNYWFGLIVIILGLIILYRDSFFSRFFQDDFELLNGASFENLLIPVPAFHYHPISNQFFYTISKSMFGTSTFGYHAILFSVTILTLLFLFKVAAVLLHSKKKALLATFFYAFNISLFALYYWVAVSYFVFGSLFFFLTIFLFLKPNSIGSSLSIMAFILALLSNELNLVLPGILFMISWYLKNWPKKLLAFFALDAFFIFLKFIWIGFPKETDYSVEISFQAFATIQWYVLRAFNLPEGIRNGTNQQIVIIFIFFLITLIAAIIKYFRSRQHNWRLLILSGSWFLIGAFPFYFLPKHMSSYYISFSLAGAVFLYSEVFSRNKMLLFIGIIIYILLAFTGLEFLSKTHWTILKPI